MSTLVSICLLLLPMVIVITVATTTEDERVIHSNEKVMSGKKADRLVESYGRFFTYLEKVTNVGLYKLLIEDYSPRRRQKRAPMVFWGKAAKAGYAAVKYLLNGAKRVSSTDKCCRDFNKKGSYFQAKGDFYKVRPSDVYKFELPNGVRAISGEVGDRTLFLRSGGKYDRDPVLEIIHRENFADPYEWKWDDPPIQRIRYVR